MLQVVMKILTSAVAVITQWKSANVPTPCEDNIMSSQISEETAVHAVSHTVVVHRLLRWDLLEFLSPISASIFLLSVRKI